MDILEIGDHCRINPPSKGFAGNVRIETAGRTIELSPAEFQAFADWAMVQDDNKTALRISLGQVPHGNLDRECTTVDGTRVKLRLASETWRKWLAARAKPAP